MNKQILSYTHRTAGVVALIMLLIFWLSTVGTELMGNFYYIKNTKYFIPYGFIILIPALIIVGTTGLKLVGKTNSFIIRNKQKRMPFIALNGLIILMPCAFYLRYLAIYEQFEISFYIVQIIELIAGAVNITMLTLNIRAGVMLVRKKGDY